MPIFQTLKSSALVRPIDPNHVSLGYDVYRMYWNPWTEMSCRLTHEGACNLKFRNSQTKVVVLANHSAQQSCWWTNQKVKRNTCCWSQARKNCAGKHTWVGFYNWLAENLAKFDSQSYWYHSRKKTAFAQHSAFYRVKREEKCDVKLPW